MTKWRLKCSPVIAINRVTPYPRIHTETLENLVSEELFPYQSTSNGNYYLINLGCGEAILLWVDPRSPKKYSG